MPRPRDPAGGPPAGPTPASGPGRPPARRRGVRAVPARVRAIRTRAERWVERRHPRLYDARHAASGLGRLLGPLVGPVLFALVVVPVVALLAGLVALLGTLGITLPSVSLPDVDLPAIHPPDWLRAVGRVLGAIFDVAVQVARPVAVGAAVLYGVLRTREAWRARRRAEAVGQTELRRRLLVALAASFALLRAEPRTGPSVFDAVPDIALP
ncbi:hypothetical protein [Patulibacter sp. SYSU D01012]|uniref:hypothetical protein n=1 Tax=Patulibacter sp. SYSU D01012 TaxID=2817381 RepID=UPI001B300E0E|nr:hypothetical protein [Patulibacter sp. SYSU D01012]